MIETFRLHQLLRETVSAPYRCLVTRPTGAAIRTRIEDRLAVSACITALLDFAEVEIIDFSCADEVVAKLVLGQGDGSGRFVVLRGLGEHQIEAVEHVLNHRRLAVMAVSDEPEAPSVLGCADPDARLAFGSVCEGPADEGALAARLGWARERAARALESLAELRLARRIGGSFHPVPVR
ncbi:MAG TPA: hypothetical protein VFU00_00130 [Gemmatimonadales bacterium]|nr:hypothetical protein [Gemmatimonadales bacterium]